jgi:hypothetical protein
MSFTMPGSTAGPCHYKKIYAQIEAWRNKPIEGKHPYLYLDGIVLKRTWAGEVRNVSLLVAISVNAEGYREILGIVEGAKEDKAGWSGFLAHLKARGLKAVELIISDACMGLVESAAEFFPEAQWQRCVVHFYRNVFSHVPAGKLGEVALMLKAIHAQESLEAAQHKTVEVVAKLRAMRLGKAAELVEAGAPETLTYYAFPEEHWRRVRTTDVIDKSFFASTTPFLRDLVFFHGTGDRVAKTKAEDVSLAARPLSSLLICGARAPGLPPARLPLADEARIGVFGALRDLDLAVAELLHVIVIGGAALSFTGRPAGLQLHGTDLGCN